MRVKLIQVTQNPIDVMWTAARTCYSEKSPIEMWEDLELYHNVIDGLSKMEDIELITDKQEQTEKHWNLVKKVLDSGHESIAETVIFTFSIEGVSRSLTHQLVRHRLACYSQQSQRYVNFKDKSFDFVTPATISRDEKTKEAYDLLMTTIKEFYDKLVDLGIPAEDARYVLPNAACTNINMTVNLRELKHICALRLCTRASLEIRQLFQAIKKEVEQVDKRLSDLLVPKCEILGFCTEHQCCHRKPHVNEVKAAYKLLGDDTILSNEDWEQLMASINNPPEVNQKLKSLLEMKSILDE